MTISMNICSLWSDFIRLTTDKVFLSLYNVTDRKERLGVQRNSLGFNLFFL